MGLISRLTTLHVLHTFWNKNYYNYLPSVLIHDARFFETNQCRTGNGKSGKSWNLRISFPRPGKSWKIKVLFGRLVTLDDKARTR